ncbi:MAG: hypothetical protein HXX11_21735 [Desulfuromonadales bacterium]|nr:hypothetical protein [Desulfuromonadales bacterium]
MNSQHKMFHLFPALYLVLLLIVMAMLSGCATPATFEGMVPESYAITQKHQETVRVVVSGGQETSAMWKTQISDEAFLQALIEAIGKSQAFSKVVQGAEAQYLLSVVLISIEQPSIGTSLTVNLETGWTLSRQDTGKIMWREAVTSEHTARVGDAFTFASRLKLATEMAAKKNIAEGLAKISKLKL